MSKRYICIHGHFYQPPRENPWLEAVELQDSAYPFHDWNERITAECYAPNTASRILGREANIIDIVNNYSKISFNFGPTLLSWMEVHSPEVYNAVIEADRLSLSRFSGHGSAMAQVYNHMIMPLASAEDKKTQTVWGIRDFEARFGRAPEGMWLPETAVDTPTLEVLVDHGISFTVLSQRQARRTRTMGGGDWKEAGGGRVDPTMPYLVRLPSGRSITVFFYDGPIAHDISFGDLLANGEDFAERLMEGFSPHHGERPGMVHIATDGENYGHHHRHGEMALSYCLYYIENRGLAELTNYGEYLERFPPSHEAEIHENSSWSCVHGVERWKEDCGCSSGMNPGWNQGWRRPLREAMDGLRRRCAGLFESEGAGLFDDPWAARDDYIDVVLDRSPEAVESFMARHGREGAVPEDRVRALKLLEMQRNAMLMYTSCGWFFDEISGIETVQVMQYAAHAIQYAGELGDGEAEDEFIAMLGRASSNVVGDGAAVYSKHVRPAMVDLLRVGGHYAISSIFESYNEHIRIFLYSGTTDIHKKNEAGKSRLVTGRARLKNDVTLEEKELTFAALYLGEQNITAGVREYRGEETCVAMAEELNKSFTRGDTTDVIRKMDKNFGENTYSIWHLFRDEQRKIVNRMLQVTYEGVEASYRHIYEDNHGMLNFLSGIDMPIPRPLAVAASYIVNLDIKRLISGEAGQDTERLQRKIDQINRWGLDADKKTLEFVVAARVCAMMKLLEEEPENTELLESTDTTLGLVKALGVEPDFWEAQNRYFRIGSTVYPRQERKAEAGDGKARWWVELFARLGMHLKVKIGG